MRDRVVEFCSVCARRAEHFLSLPLGTLGARCARRMGWTFPPYVPRPSGTHSYRYSHRDPLPLSVRGEGRGTGA